MKYSITDIIKLLPKNCQVDDIDRIIMIILDFLVYMKPGDSISIPGDVQFDKIGKAEILIPQFVLPKEWQDREFKDVVNMLQEYKLIKSR